MRDKNKITIITFMISGAFLMTYMLSLTDMDDTKVVQKSNHEIIADKETRSNSESIVKIDNEIKSVAIVKKKQLETQITKLAPRHLYVRNSTQIEEERTRRAKSQKRYLKMKKTREDNMRRQRRQQHINKLKGNENV